MTDPGSNDNRASAPTIRLVALTGFMGSGKTTVGRELADLLGWVFHDLDELIETREHISILELFRQQGEAEFRTVEHATLAAFLAECSEPTVLALGGGAFVQTDNAELLRQSWIRTVFLEVAVEELFRRCSAEIGENAANVRPLAVDRALFEKLHNQRLPHYRRADLIFCEEEATAHEVAAQISAELGLRNGA